MSVGGWKCKKFACEYKSTKPESSKSILRACGDAILNLGAGWSLDESRNATLDDFVQIGSYSDTSDSYQPALFFVHSGGAKLMLTFAMYRQSLNKSLNPTGSSNDTIYQFGVAAAMIPKQHSALDWDNTSNYTSISAIPVKAARLVGTHWHTSATYSSHQFHSSTPINIVVIGKDDTLTILAVLTNSSTRPRSGFSLGSDLIPTLACEGDTDTSGAILYGDALVKTTGSPIITEMTSDTKNYISAGFNPVAADKTFKCGISSELYSCNVVSQGYLLNPSVTEYSITGRVRFVALGAVMYSDNLLENNVVKGDGFKGYYSTDFIRYIGWESHLPVGQLIDGGNFIHLGAGIIHGWDASITDSIL